MNEWVSAASRFNPVTGLMGERVESESRQKKL